MVGAKIQKKFERTSVFKEKSSVCKQKNYLYTIIIQIEMQSFKDLYMLKKAVLSYESN